MKKLLLVLVALGTSSAFAAVSKNYNDVKKVLSDIVDANPKIVTPFVLANSDDGVPIQGIKIGNGPVHNIVVATHHGNEYGSTEVALGFAREIAQHPIDGQTMYVIPVLNINGYNARNRNETVKGHQYDPNRDYPGPCGTEGPFHLKSTSALAKFIDEQNIVASATLHTYYPAVVYPWGISTHDVDTPYMSTFTDLVEAATKWSHYQVGNSTNVIYPADGCYEDYAFWKHGIWSILFELGETHNPDDNQVAEMVKTNVPGLRAMFEKAPTARATDHEFHGRCDAKLRGLDRHDE